MGAINQPLLSSSLRRHLDGGVSSQSAPEQNVRASSTTTIGMRVSRCTLELVLLTCGLRRLVRSALSCSEPYVCLWVLKPRVVVCRVQKPFCLRSWLPLHPPSHSWGSLTHEHDMTKVTNSLERTAIDLRGPEIRCMILDRIWISHLYETMQSPKLSSIVGVWAQFT